MTVLIDVLGWVGSVLVVSAYGLNTYKKIASDSFVFYLMNIVGGIFLVIYSLEKGAYANTFINIVWVIIAVPAVLKLWQRVRRGT
ncbi:CBU_0592 family membrane protein [Chryseolinea lacunae]|uniref:CBU-0592-like domain-containing protein n=1 Tax=Chryseolinea lacunae TaxID=2801331 RepID=A0ABS1KK51_9BACT|nr:hypothetical protein [Chryseolinea lacunae]MBL0739729.1 hypothetical protein [Chryseolinea lacunae]